MPSGIEDIIYEGYTLSHCTFRTERYYGRILSRESYILFLRRNEDPEIPWYTLEVEPSGVVRQKRTFGDDQDSSIDEINKFLREWQKVVQSRLTAADKRLGAKSREERLRGFDELRKNKTIVRTGYLTGKLLADVLEADLLDISFEAEGEAKTKEKVG